MDLPAQESRRTVGSKCQVWHSKCRQSRTNDSRSKVGGEPSCCCCLPSVESFVALVDGPPAAAPGDKVVAVVVVVVFVVAAPDMLAAAFARLVWLPCSGSKLLLLPLVCLP